MKRPSDDDGDANSSSNSRSEEFAKRVLAGSRKLIFIGGIVFVILIIVALLVSKLSGGSH